MSKPRRTITSEQKLKLEKLRGESINANELQNGNYRVRISDEELNAISKMVKSEIESGKEEEVKLPKVVSKLLERYTEKELELIAKGEGFSEKPKETKKVKLSGKHHRIGVISDGHLGSKYASAQWHLQAFQEFESKGCECVVHVGDLVEGLTPRRFSTQVYELTHLGYKSQKSHAIDVFSKCNIPLYVISGNHDGYFQEYAGANIVEDICNNLPLATYLGHDCADITIDGVSLRLFHGTDGSSYALSYRTQKIVESINAKDKCDILICGHTHKFCYIYERNIHTVSAPCLQKQTWFMRSKKLSAHTGFLILDFDVIDKKVCNFQVKLYPLGNE